MSVRNVYAPNLRSDVNSFLELTFSVLRELERFFWLMSLPLRWRCLITKKAIMMTSAVRRNLLNIQIKPGIQVKYLKLDFESNIDPACLKYMSPKVTKV